MVGRAERNPFPAPPDVWATLVCWRAERRRFALLTVIESRGFTPAKAGARMLLGSQGSTVGTIGGGAIEHAALAEAGRLMGVDGATSVFRRHLTQELGMCCGGEMSVFIEVMAPAPRLLLLGAGTIARPLAAMAALCGFEVTVADERPEWATPERFPGATVLCRDPERALEALAPTDEDYAVVVTHDHALDQRLVQTLLGTRVRFLGLVGSVPKQRKFALRLKARGYPDSEIARVRAPLGIPIGAASAEEIAVSVVAELIAVRRGHAPKPGWVPPARAERATDDPITEGRAR